MSTPAATLNPTEAIIARRIDFPTWVPAMLVKELRQGLRQRGFVGALVGFQVIMTLFLIFAIAGGSGSATFNTLQGAFWVMINVQLLVITPLRALTGLQEELDSRWVDLLMLTRLTAWRIVVGKWVSLVVQGALLVIALLPYGVARYFFGSVDLIGEARLIALIFAAAAVLTAAALWSSVLPKLARVALGIGVVFIWQFLPGSLAMIFSGGGRAVPMGPTAILTGANWWLVLFDTALLLTLCLVGAVRRLAPRAESQTPLMRLLPILGALPVPFLALRNMLPQLVLAGIFFAFVAALELARAEEPMENHWRAWSRFGAWGRGVGRFVQPGWASAIEWVMAVAAVVALGGLASLMPWKVALTALLAAEALVFPVLLLTWMSAQFSQRTAGYVLVLGGASLIAAVGAAAGSAGAIAPSLKNFSAIADRVMLVLPISSFWVMLRVTVPPATSVLLPQILMAGAVLGGTWLRARRYRLQRRVFETAPTEEPTP